MALRMGALYDALRAANVPHDLAAAAAEEVAAAILARRPRPLPTIRDTVTDAVSRLTLQRARLMHEIPEPRADTEHDTEKLSDKVRRLNGMLEQALEDLREYRARKDDGQDPPPS